MSDAGIEPPALPWSHNGPLSLFDHSSIRRGYHVYKQVCSTCHSIERIHFRELVDVAFTLDEAKAMAAEEDIRDGPNEEGDMFERPGRLTDAIPSPYENDEQARAANAGSLPPDLSLVVKARHGGADYIYALLTGYSDPPEGVKLRQGLYYNGYFPGGAIGMKPPLSDEQTDYDDGTPATISQQAKDVVTFLSWCAEPEHDQRKITGAKAMLLLGLLAASTWSMKRFRWSMLKTRRIVVLNK